MDNDSEKPVDACVVGPGPCVYFPERIAHATVVDSDEHIKPTVYSHLAQAGFRRTGSTFYLPDCAGCHACIPLRVVADAFQSHRRFRRLLARNDDRRGPAWASTAVVSGYNESHSRFNLGTPDPSASLMSCDRFKV